MSSTPARPALSDAVIEDLRQGKRPAALQPDEAVIHDFVVELSNTRRVEMPAYRAAVDLVGEVGVIELVGIIGYYAFIAMTLNVFDVETLSGDVPLKIAVNGRASPARREVRS